jgi:hypothetical protein
MTWEGPKISLIGAQTVFGQVADIEKHELGHYKATLQSGQTLECRTLMELCQSIVKKLAGSGSAPEEVVAPELEKV